MCFSASSSFVASAGLIAGGIALQRYRCITKHQRLLAFIPLIFALHQFLEGIVWLGVNAIISAPTQAIAAYSFNIIAFVVWPIYMPLAVLKNEQSQASPYLKGLIGMGLGIGSYYFWCFTFYSPLQILVNCSASKCDSLSYVFSLPYFDSAINYFYFTTTVMPFFLSRNRRIKTWVGPAFLASFLMTLLILNDPPAFPSVWCFFAAIVSASVFLSFPSVSATGQVDVERLD